MGLGINAIAKEYSFWVPLMCLLSTHIKFSIFRNIFSEIKKVVITFSILEKKNFKNKN